jgi:hypothetical protein
MNKSSKRGLKQKKQEIETKFARAIYERKEFNTHRHTHTELHSL